MPGGQHHNMLPVGFYLENYRIEAILGYGGFGITYQALDEDLQQVVAIKEYLPRDAAFRDQDSTVTPLSESDRDTFEWGLERFLDEARTLARFRHPNIVGVRRFLRANGTAYLVMDYCEGESLESVLARQETLSASHLALLLTPLLNALEELHQSGLTHRDIKPANIYLREDGSPVLLDFGAARQALAQHSRSVTAIVTPGYAAFEQYGTKVRQGPWTDIYGLGATLYRCVTGNRPLDAPDRLIEDDLKPALAAAKGRYPRPMLSMIDAAMRVQPSDRPQNVAEWRLIGGLHARAKEDREATVQIATPTRVLRTPKKRAGWAAVVIGLFGVTGIGYIIWSMDMAPSSEIGGTSAFDLRGEEPALEAEVGDGTGETDRAEEEARLRDVAEAQPREHERATEEHVANQRLLEVERLLAAAEEHLNADRLMAPVDRNAFAHYREALSIDPQNSIALEGLVRIVGRYIELVHVALLRGDTERAEVLLQRAMTVGPGDPALDILSKFVRGLKAHQRQDYSTAYQEYLAAAEHGYVGAFNNLGALYASGHGVQQSDAEAVRWYRLAAELGFTLAQSNLGWMYLDGQGVEKNDVEGMRWFRLAAEQGDAVAQFNLGRGYATGQGVSRSDAEAVRWYRMAAEQGHARAQFSLGLRYSNGQGIARNDQEAARWYRLAAEQGHSGAQSKLGVKYSDGRGVERNYAEAARWYRMASEQGDAVAQFNLGLAYANGRGVGQNDREAVRWYRLAAEQGDSSAQFNLGAMYSGGRGVSRNDAEAARWYRKAAEQGDADAQHNLGLSYFEGVGVELSYAEALRWFQYAGAQGYVASQINVGLMHENGWGVNRDLEEAVRWYQIAADQGSPEAAARVNALR